MNQEMNRIRNEFDCLGILFCSIPYLEVQVSVMYQWCFLNFLNTGELNGKNSCLWTWIEMQCRRKDESIGMLERKLKRCDEELECVRKVNSLDTFWFLLLILSFWIELLLSFQFTQISSFQNFEGQMIDFRKIYKNIQSSSTGVIERDALRATADRYYIFSLSIKLIFWVKTSVFYFEKRLAKKILKWRECKIIESAVKKK